jgi:mono/diheme cytochrome c family protein
MSRLVLLLSLLAMVATAAEAAGAVPEGAAKADREAAGIFTTTCGYCHQDGGRAGGGIGPKLMGTTRSDDFILNRIRNGYSGKMPAFGGTLSDAQIRGLLRYIRHLKPEN